MLTKECLGLEEQVLMQTIALLKYTQKLYTRMKEIDPIPPSILVSA